MWIRVLALALLAMALWSVFRLAMGLRAAKALRERRREAEESRGRRVVAEIPDADDLGLFLEDDEGFYWGGEEVRKRELVGARLRLNGGVLASWSLPDARLPEPRGIEEYEGREQWDVHLHLADGSHRVVPCGRLREGVSREIATRVFEASRQ